MTVSQQKLELAVLLKLYLHSEADGGELTPEGVRALFGTPISLRRIETALVQLDTSGEAVNEYDPHYFEEGLWKITRQGIITTERALRTPSSFIARLNENGDQWLETEEARTVVLKKLEPKASKPALESEPETEKASPPLSIINNFNPINTQTVGGTDPSAKSAAIAGWANVWVATAVGAAVILVTLWIAGKL